MDPIICRQMWNAFRTKLRKYENKFGNSKPQLNKLNEWEEFGAKVEADRISREACSPQQYVVVMGSEDMPIPLGNFWKLGL